MIRLTRLFLGMAALALLSLAPVASANEVPGEEGGGSAAVREMLACNSDGTYHCGFTCPDGYKEKGWCCYG